MRAHIRCFVSIVSSLFVCVCAVYLPGAHAQPASYPSKPVQIVVPVPPGGSLDLLARIMADQLQRRLNVSVLVVNRPGAAGLVGATVARRMAPDGYSLLIANDSVLTLPLFIKAEYDAEKDFTPVAMMAENPNFFFASAKLPIRSLLELVDYAKANPGKLNFAVYPNTRPYFQSVRFQNATGVNVALIPYNGAGPAIPAMLAGEVHVHIGSPSGWIEQVRAGTVRAIAVGGSRRIASMPDVPLAKASGLDVDFENWVTWYGFFGPAPLPREVVAVLSDAMVEAAKRPEVEAQIRKLGAEPAPLGAAEFAVVVSRAISSTRSAAQAAGIKLQ